MVTHIVMFRLRGDEKIRRETAEKFKLALDSLMGVIPELKSMEVGVNDNAAEQWDVVLTTTFDDWAGLNAYATHPDHLAAAAIIAPVKAERACVDYLS